MVQLLKYVQEKTSLGKTIDAQLQWHLYRIYTTLQYTNQTFWHIKSHLVLVQVLPESSPYDLRAIPQQSPDIKQFIVLYTDE